MFEFLFYTPQEREKMELSELRELAEKFLEIAEERVKESERRERKMKEIEEIQKKEYTMTFSKGAREAAQGRASKTTCQDHLKKLLSITVGYQIMPGPLKASCMQDLLNRITKAYNSGEATISFLVGINLPVGSKKAAEIIGEPTEQRAWQNDFISEIIFRTKWETLGPEEVSNGQVLKYEAFTIHFRD